MVCGWKEGAVGAVGAAPALGHRDSWVGGGRKVMVQGDGRPGERVNSFPQARRCGRLFDPTIKDKSCSKGTKAGTRIPR